MTSLNKQEITRLLAENKDSPAELIAHLNHLLQTSQKLEATFSNNPKYSQYVENAAAKNSLPTATQLINKSNKELSHVGKAFLTRELGNPSRFRP